MSTAAARTKPSSAPLAAAAQAPPRIVVSIEHAAGQGERSPVVDKFETRKHEVHLRQQLVIDAEHELVRGHLLERAEMTVTDGADHGIDPARLPVDRANTVDILDIGPDVAAAATDSDDLVARRQRLEGCPAHGANDNYLQCHISFRCGYDTSLPDPVSRQKSSPPIASSAAIRVDSGAKSTDQPRSQRRRFAEIFAEIGPAAERHSHTLIAQLGEAGGN